MRGDGRQPVRPVRPGDQIAAIEALVQTLKPSELALPATVLKNLPPRPSGYDSHRELFPRYTGSMFDAITPAVVAADLTVSFLLNTARAARLVEQHALDHTLPGLDAVIDRLVAATFKGVRASRYEAEIARATQRVVVEHLMTLATESPMSQVRAIATWKLRQRMGGGTVAADSGDGAHAQLLAADIRRFLERPSAPIPRMEIPSAPPGAPIGEPAMDWLRRTEIVCSNAG
jgi:hypothetical protein